MIGDYRESAYPLRTVPPDKRRCSLLDNPMCGLLDHEALLVLYEPLIVVKVGVIL
jgi:hypothetical protein